MVVIQFLVSFRLQLGIGMCLGDMAGTECEGMRGEEGTTAARNLPWAQRAECSTGQHTLSLCPLPPPFSHAHTEISGSRNWKSFYIYLLSPYILHIKYFVYLNFTKSRTIRLFSVHQSNHACRHIFYKFVPRFSNAFDSLAFSSSPSIENYSNQRSSPYINLQPLTSMLSRASAPSVLNPLTSLATNTYFPARQIRSPTQPQRAYLIKVKSKPHVSQIPRDRPSTAPRAPHCQQRGQRMHQHRRCQALSRFSRGGRHNWLNGVPRSRS